jgi:hypothetical protein
MGQVGLFSIVKWACFGLTKTIEEFLLFRVPPWRQEATQA